MITNLKKLKKPNKLSPDYKKLYYGILKKFNQTLSELDQARSDNRKMIEDKAVFNNLMVRITGEVDTLSEQNRSYRYYQEKYNKLQNDLIDCLSNDECEAASIAGFPKEVYAVELLRIFQEWKITNRLSHEYGRERAQH